MKIRIKFAKSGIARFIGHLDVMRYFQKAMRRAGVAIRYSGGFSPHQIMSFAAPLGVGITSNGEYLDIEVDDQEDTATMSRRLNQVMAEGFSIRSCRVLSDNAGNAMSLVAAASYTVAFRPGYVPENAGQWMQDLVKFYGQERVPITKKTKKGQKELDLKPLIYQLSLKPLNRTCLSAEAAQETAPALSCLPAEAVQETAPVLFMMISTGSTENIKPDLVLDAYYQHLGQERPEFAFQIQREEVYARKNPEKEGPYSAGDFIPLEEFGCIN